MSKSSEKIARSKGKSQSPSLDVEMKLGILHTIANSIYSSTEGKIREAVANSSDNKAGSFAIYIDHSTAALSLFDNGHGIDEKRFKEIFANLGYGLGKEDLSSLSYFGLGLMSIIRLGKKAKIYTRPHGSDEIFLLSIDVDPIFDPANEKKQISVLKDHIGLKKSDLISRAAKSPLTDGLIKKIYGTFPGSFTEIIIEDVHAIDLERIASQNFITELRKTLPLKPEKNDSFLSRITDPTASIGVQKIFENSDFFPTVDVYFGIAGEMELTQLWRYFPEFKKELEFGEANISFGEKNDFAYYILYATEDLERREKENAETGFWVRNRNFLVKPADFFQPPGSRKQMVHEPLKNWIFGEIFHKNMNNFLIVSRNDYRFESQEFEKFRNEVMQLVYPLNSELRVAWQYGNVIVKTVINPFKEIELNKGPFKRVGETLSQMGIPCDGKDAEEILKKIAKNRNQEVENAPRVSRLIEKGSGQIIIADDEESLVIIDKNVKDDLFTQAWDEKAKRIKISISPSLFSDKEVIFLGKSFKVHFVAGSEASAGISIDAKDGKIYVNPFNHELMKYSISFLDVYIAVDLADSLAKNKKEMREYILKILGRDYVSPTKFFTPLADDLQRKNRS